MKKMQGNKFFKVVLASALVISMCGAIFVAANNQLLSMEEGKVEDIPTTYNTASVPETKTSSDYVKPDYEIEQIENIATTLNKAKASFASAISAEEASEIGVKAVCELFPEADLNGKKIKMLYFVDPERIKAYWGGDVYNESDLKDQEHTPPMYSFTIDAITGENVELFKGITTIEHGEKMDFDREKLTEDYANNCDEYLQLAEEHIQKYSGAKAVSSKFKDISAFLSFDKGLAIDSANSNTIVLDKEAEIPEKIVYDEYENKADFIMLIIEVTDEYGRQYDINIKAETMELISINMLVPKDPNGEIGLG